jgi:hypothetical protein
VTSRRTKADVDQVAVTIPLHADRRNFYKVEKWSRDGQRVEDICSSGIAPSSYSLSYHLPT